MKGHGTDKKKLGDYHESGDGRRFHRYSRDLNTGVIREVFIRSDEFAELERETREYWRTIGEGAREQTARETARETRGS